MKSRRDAWAGYRGLLLPHTTQIPDVILDHWAPRLTEAQLRVVLYVARRTYGWRKEADRISLRQFCHGITRKDGTCLDEGTGLSRPAVIQACRQLVEAGLLRKEARRGRDGRSATCVFSLNLDGSIESIAEQRPLPRKRRRRAAALESASPDLTPRGEAAPSIAGTTAALESDAGCEG